MPASISLSRELNEECGVIGIFDDPEAANLAYLGLFALQHRGQEACGIVTLDDSSDDTFSSSKAELGSKLISHRSFGLVADVFTREVLQKLKGQVAIGHVRYSTQGGRLVQNIQPFFFESTVGPIAIAHNGNLTNSKSLRAELEGLGSIFQSTSDSEIFLHLLARSQAPTVAAKISEVANRVDGAYSLVILTEDSIYALRDPFGFRPLVLGRRGKGHIVASETCALDLIDAELVREVLPGELVTLSRAGVTSELIKRSKRTALCSFEPIYFARPDSRVFGKVMYNLRKKMGAQLARECPVNGDLVIAVPDSGVAMATGFAQAAGLPLEVGLVRNHYIGRTFIEPSQAIRDFGVKLKLNPVPEILNKKRVIVVDDSIVRGTTSVKIIRMLRNAGASEVHLRIGSPPITHSCFYGVDTPKRKDLLAARMTVEEIRKFVAADSLGFLSVAGLQTALGQESSESYCFACFSGKYWEDIHAEIPVQPTDENGPGLLANGNSLDL